MPIMFVLDAQVKERFFDRAAVLKQLSATERRALSRMGAFIRRRAQTDVLRRTIPKGNRKRTGGRNGRFKRIKQSAGPGQPPVVHSRNKYASLRNILFALGPTGQSVIVGPVGIPSLRLTGASAQTVPELMEFGGTATITESVYPSGLAYPGKSKTSEGATLRTRKATYSKHPFMSVALEREARAGTLVDAFSYGVR
jgi:hypothetical protein